ncbi:hypothetical protein Mal33_48760 [Rosistilla oblonga]|uniref:Uncharacterized protein n=1 Tax=Rosistilla oblonga TaxID=2527990 RepID=A0A518J0I1_9BACT|nr:hypothetical protein Mal33_48760 [Rosistilla oblonga]
MPAQTNAGFVPPSLALVCEVNLRIRPLEIRGVVLSLSITASTINRHGYFPPLHKIKLSDGC